MGADSLTQRLTSAARPTAGLVDWLRVRDPGYAALRRATRAALLMPAVFALGDKVIGEPLLATFAAFGSFAMLLLVDFSGSIKDRLLDQTALGLACAALICLATLVSRTTWLAAVSMAVLAFGVLFAGVLSSVLAGATTTLLLAFILPVSLQGSLSSIPERVEGWGLAAGVSLLAISLLWPAPTRNPVRIAAIETARALAAQLRSDVAYMMGDPADDEQEQTHHAAIAAAQQAVQKMQDLFFATPYRPTALSADARAVVKVIDELRWLNTIMLRSAPKRHSPGASRRVGAVKTAAAETLADAADLLEDPRRARSALRRSVERMRAALAELEEVTTALLPGQPLGGDHDDALAERVVSSLDPSFRVQQLSFIVGQIASSADLAAAAARRSWIDRLLGRQSEGVQGPLAEAHEQAGAYIERHSLTLQNSVRGAVALALAVLVADLTTVQHGFWVVFGTLAVLRSNALSTGQNVLRALAGTTVGFAVGGALVYLIGTDTTLLWALLPIVVLFAGLAPSCISFAGGQAAFTLTLLILFNLIAPAGWTIGLVRIEDVALGCAVSLLVGLLFWPRGAGAALRSALARAYRESVRYLADAVAYGVGCCDPSGPQFPPPQRQALDAAAASHRLDETFRGYLIERGSKRAPLADVAALVTGVTGLRLAGDAVLDLWHAGQAGGGERSAARRELILAAEHVANWYERFAASLTSAERVPDPLARDEVADGRLIEAVERDLSGSDGRATATGVRVIWTGDHLDGVRRLQEPLAEQARAAVTAQPPR
jgi:uncharacterized membrane protein YccC